MKRLLLIAVALLVGGMAMTAQAQVDRMKPIEADKEIRTGVLPNGLTYYVRHNEKPKNMANFYIVHDVGAIQEDDSQQGLAHFLEHMAFNGTKNFPDKTLIEYLEKIGVKFGANLNAFTSFPCSARESSTRRCSSCTTGRTSSLWSPRRSIRSAE